MSRSGRFEPMGGWGYAGSPRSDFDPRPTAAEINWSRAGRAWPADVAHVALPAEVEVVPVMGELGVATEADSESLQVKEL